MPIVDMQNGQPVFSNSQVAWLQEQEAIGLLIISNLIFLLTIVLILYFERRTVRYYENQIAQLEDKSRRVFMNPHFFFNALNGIQGLYITSGLKATNQYIGKLSNLLRFTLELNVNNYITLEDEMAYITNYVELMQFRLNKKFTYCFDYQTKRVLSKYHIPPMLIQPVVENAILHGLTPLEAEGALSLQIKEQNKALRILIKDNGIGVAESKRLQKKRQRKSYGTRILRERISIYNKLHREDIYFFLNPKRTKKQQLMGTEALLILPILKNKPKRIFKQAPTQPLIPEK